MTFITMAKVFVTRALQDELVLVENYFVRRDQPHGDTGPQISPGVIAGIAIGCASFVLLAILAVVVPILYIRYLKKLDKQNRRMAASEASNPNDDLHTTLQPHTSLRHSMVMPHSHSTAWGALSSQEDVSETPYLEQAQQEQKKPSFLSWPNSRRSWKKKRLQAKRARQSTLSAIFENHQTVPGAESGTVDETVASIDGTQTSLRNETTSEEVQAQNEATEEAMATSGFQPNQVHGRSASDTFSASDLIPTPDEGDQEGRFSTYGSRSRSHSTMFANFSQEMELDHVLRQTEERRISRTSSIRSKIGTAPDEPLPPLPSNFEQSGSHAKGNPIRPESALSTSTVESTATSIMDPPPQSINEYLPQRQDPTNADLLDSKTGNEVNPGGNRNTSPEYNVWSGSHILPSFAPSRTGQALSLYERQRYSMGSRNNRLRAKTAMSLPEGDVAGAVSVGRPSSSAVQAEAVPQIPSSKRSSQIRKSKSVGDFVEPTTFQSSSDHNFPEEGESVQQFVQTLGTGSSPGSLFQWVMHAVSRKGSPKSSQGSGKTQDAKAPRQDSVSPTYTMASFNPLPYRRMNNIPAESKTSNASRLKQSSTSGPKPSLEENSSVSSGQYHSHQTSSASKSLGRSFETSDDPRDGTDTTFSSTTPNSRHNKNSSNDSPLVGRTSSAYEEVLDVSHPRKNVVGGPIWPSSPDSSSLDEVTWNSSPPLPRNQMPPPSTHAKTRSAPRFSLLPAPSMGEQRLPPGSRIPRKPNYGPPRSQPSTTPPPTRVLRPMTADARINRSHMQGYQQSPQVNQQNTSERWNTHDRTNVDDKENDRYRRGGGVWTGLDDLEDFWGTSERKRRPRMFDSNKKTLPLHLAGNNKSVSRERLDTRHTTPSDDAEDDTSLEDENNFF